VQPGTRLLQAESGWNAKTFADPGSSASPQASTDPAVPGQELHQGRKGSHNRGLTKARNRANVHPIKDLDMLDRRTDDDLRCLKSQAQLGELSTADINRAHEDVEDSCESRTRNAIDYQLWYSSRHGQWKVMHGRALRQSENYCDHG
jgi:hypothetical protein